MGTSCPLPAQSTYDVGSLDLEESGVRLDLGADHVSPGDVLCRWVIWAQTLEGGRTGFAGPAGS